MSSKPAHITKKLSKYLKDTIQECELLGQILYKSQDRYKHDLPKEERRDFWAPVANELRYAGQHICRFLCSSSLPKQQTEINQIKGHCERAKHDAHDCIILFFARIIRYALRMQERSSIITAKAIAECNQSKKKFYDICKDLAANSTRRPNRRVFMLQRQEYIDRLQNLFARVMKSYHSNRPAVEESAIDLCVARNSDPTPKEMLVAFNQAESYMKQYELVSGSANIYGVKNLSQATACLAKNDCRAFVEWCDYTQIEILNDIVTYFRYELGIVDDPAKMEKELKGKSIDERKAYLENLIDGLAKQWYGG